MDYLNQVYWKNWKIKSNILLWALSMSQAQCTMVMKPVQGLGTFRSVMFIYSTLQMKKKIWNSHLKQKLFMKAKVFKSDLNSSTEATHISVTDFKAPWKLPPFIWFVYRQLRWLTSQTRWFSRDVQIKCTKKHFRKCLFAIEITLHQCCLQGTRTGWWHGVVTSRLSWGNDPQHLNALYAQQKSGFTSKRYSRNYKIKAEWQFMQIWKYVFS